MTRISISFEEAAPQVKTTHSQEQYVRQLVTKLPAKKPCHAAILKKLQADCKIRQRPKVGASALLEGKR